MIGRFGYKMRPYAEGDMGMASRRTDHDRLFKELIQTSKPFWRSSWICAFPKPVRCLI